MTAKELREAREVKNCTKCGEEKALSDFYIRQGATRYNECKKCLNSRTSSKKRDREEYTFSPIGFAQYLVASARQRAKKRNVDFSISIDFVLGKLNTGKCEATGIKLLLARGKRGPFSPTLDQIKPGQGYTEENTQVVCWIYNAAKGDGTHDDVLSLAEALIHGK